MRDVAAATTLLEFRNMLQEWEELHEDNWNSDERSQKKSALKNAIGVQLEYVRELVSTVVTVEPLVDRWNDAAPTDPFDGIFKEPRLAGDVRTLINRAIGIYQRGGTANRPSDSAQRDAMRALAAFRKTLDEWAPLWREAQKLGTAHLIASLKSSNPPRAAPNPRMSELHAAMNHEITHVARLVKAVMVVRSVRKGAEELDPFDALFDEPSLMIPKVSDHIARAIGAYERGEHRRDASGCMTPASSLTIAREGVFFAGQPFDAMRAISGILATATRSIALVDAYIGETTLDILTARPSGVTVAILTHDKPRQTTTPALKALGEAWKKQHGGGLSVRLSTAFHDRFIVIDDAELYHLGTSIKDAALKGGFMFSRIEEPSVVTALLDRLAKEWPAAKVFI